MAEGAFYFQPLRVSFVLFFLVLSADACIQMKDLSHSKLPLFILLAFMTQNLVNEESITQE